MVATASASFPPASVMTAGNPFAGLPPAEFPLLAKAAGVGALSDGLSDVLGFAVDGMIAALEAKVPPPRGEEGGSPARPNLGENP